jgi:pyrroline-5-carboxylate reductase
VNNCAIAFIGAGNMARSLISGLLASGHPASQLAAADPAEEQRALIQALGVHSAADNSAIVTAADVIVLAVKPQILAKVVANLSLAPTQLVISIAAGVTMDSISAMLGAQQPLVRCMPNTPALLQQGITGLCANTAVSADQRAQAEQLLAAAGATLWFDQEADLDAVTAVSGSGPAYFFYLMEAMIDAGERLGLERDIATQLTLATARGAAAMAEQGASQGQTPAMLRTNVTSPGGTTERALAIMDQHNTQAHLGDAIAGAAQRAQELAEELAKDFDRS